MYLLNIALKKNFFYLNNVNTQPWKQRPIFFSLLF